MAIEINGLSGDAVKLASNGGQVANTQRSVPTGATTTAPVNNDQLSLTGSATRLRDFESEVAKLPVVDSRKVGDVQRAIATGGFQIDPGQVAEKMLSLEAALP